MSDNSPPSGFPWSRLARRLAIFALPAMVMVGCSDDDNPPPAPTATTTATAVPATATSTATRTAAPPTQTAPAPTQTQTPPPTSTATRTPNDSAASACAKLANCQQCFSDENGQCIANEACASRLSGDAAICINSSAGCDATALGDCLFLGCQGNDATGECQ